MKIKVCTWNISEGIETTCDFNNLIEKNVENSELLKSITKIINENDFDVVCFQEYPTEKDPLNNVNKLFFNNPKLSHTSSRTGQTFYSFDKGIISADMIIENESFHLVTGHAIAFAPCGCTEKDYPESYIPLENEICNNYKNNLN